MSPSQLPALLCFPFWATNRDVIKVLPLKGTLTYSYCLRCQRRCLLACENRKCLQTNRNDQLSLSRVKDTEGESLSLPLSLAGPGNGEDMSDVTHTVLEVNLNEDVSFIKAVGCSVAAMFVFGSLML